MGMNVDVNELARQVAEALKPIAAKIGEGAETVYRMAAKDAFITGIESFVYSSLGVICLGIAAFTFKKTFNSKLELESKIQIFVFVVGGFVTLGIVLFAVNIGNAIHYTFNPEYMALKDLLRSIK